MRVNKGVVSIIRAVMVLVLAGVLSTSLGCQNYREAEGRTAGEITDDLAIQTALKSRLFADDQVSGFKVQTEVYKGVVTLFGRVPDESTRARALTIAREIKGVSRVDDRLTIVAD